MCSVNLTTKRLAQGVTINSLTEMTKICNTLKYLKLIQNYNWSESDEPYTIDPSCANVVVDTLECAEYIMQQDAAIYQYLRTRITEPCAGLLFSNNVLLYKKFQETEDPGAILSHISYNICETLGPHTTRSFFVCPCICSCGHSNNCESMLNFFIDYRILTTSIGCNRFKVNYEVPLTKCDPDTCNICFQECENVLKCGHKFHKDCIEKYKSECSMCGYAFDVRIQSYGFLTEN
jgi:hypothetical protein